jgi:hypothetical protein
VRPGIRLPAWIAALFLAGQLVLRIQASDEKNACEDSNYKYEFASNVANLRWSLFALSELTFDEKIDSMLATDLTNYAAISLANTLSLRASYVKKCGAEDGSYLEELRNNERFARLMVDITSSEKSPAAKRIDKEYPALALWAAPQVVIRQNKLPPPRGPIAERLSSLQKEAGYKPNNPYSIVISRLLGKSDDYIAAERNIAVLETIPVNPKGLFYGKSLRQSLAMNQERETVGLLRSLDEYYMKPAKVPDGVPPSLAVTQ